MKECLLKLFSGRYLLTVICGFTFAYVSMMKIIPPEATIAIISTVFTAYFNRGDRSNITETEKKL